MGNIFRKSDKPSLFPESGRILSIDVDRIHPNPHQPREDFSSEALASLAESIRKYGILQPISVRRSEAASETKVCSSPFGEISFRDGSSFEIVAGERRFRAAKSIGLRSVPCIVLDIDRNRSAELALIENIQRENLNPFEQASALASLMELNGLTQEQVAHQLSSSQSYVANKLRLLRLSLPERNLILTAGLSERHARALLRIEDPEKRIPVLRKIIDREMTVAQTETYIASVAEPPPAPPVRRMLVRDIRIFANTVERAIAAVRDSGIEVIREKRESEDEIEYVIRVPKKFSHPA